MADLKTVLNHAFDLLSVQFLIHYCFLFSPNQKLQIQLKSTPFRPDVMYLYVYIFYDSFNLLPGQPMNLPPFLFLLAVSLSVENKLGMRFVGNLILNIGKMNLTISGYLTILPGQPSCNEFSELTFSINLINVLLAQSIFESDLF